MWRYDLDREAMLHQGSSPSDKTADLETYARSHIAGDELVEATHQQKLVEIIPGKYHPRIYRPGAIEDNFRENGCPISDPKAIGQCLVATNILLEKLKNILETIELADQNLDVYGHEIRNLLLLSSMEVESVLSAILRENKYPAGRWNTNDYVKLCKPLNLETYEVKFNLYPEFNAVSPFKGWNSGSPTQSLGWYNAYNKTKHDRELNINNATLRQTILGVSAVATLLYVQFGPDHNFWQQGELANILVSTTHNYDTSEYYIPYSADKSKQCIWKSSSIKL